MKQINRRFYVALALLAIWSVAGLSHEQAAEICEKYAAPIEQAVQAVSETAASGASLSSFLPGSYK